MQKEISDLWKLYKKTYEPELRDKLIVSYLPLVKYVLGRISLYLPPHLDSEDLTISGVIGLIKSVEEFDLTRQIEFTTFARTTGCRVRPARRLPRSPTRSTG